MATQTAMSATGVALANAGRLLYIAPLPAKHAAEQIPACFDVRCCGVLICKAPAALCCHSPARVGS